MYKHQKKQLDFLIYPIFLILLIVPLIVHMRNVPISASAAPFWKGEPSDSDFFSYYKMVWFFIFTCFAIIALAIKIYGENEKIKKTYLYVPMGVYAFFVIVSSLFSKSQDVVYKGFPNRYEGMFVLLAYMVILFIVINLLDTEKQLRLLMIGILISATIMGIIGAFQYINMDFFQTVLGKKLMLPISEWSIAGTLKFQLGPRAVYGTLYHTNYVGSFMAMLLPLCLAFAILIKNNTQKIVSGVLAGIMFLNLIASHSRAGIWGSTFAIVLLIILGRKKLIKNWKYTIGVAVVLMLVAFGANAVTKGDITSKIGTMTNDSDPSPTASLGIKSLIVNKNLIKITDANGVLNINWINNQITITDENNKKVPFNFNSKLNIVSFSQPKYSPYILNMTNLSSNKIFELQRAPLNIYFKVTPTGYKLYAGNGQVYDIKPVAKWGFVGHENFASARGYIWSRSLPLLKNTIIAGFGPDTFAIHFPQYDYIGKLLAYGDMTMIVDKPHNLYLQTGLNTGIISLLALLALFIMYFISGIRIYWKSNFDNFFEICGLGLFTAVGGYLFAGLANDSTLSVSPVFWVLMGIGISINLKLSKQKDLM
jgi:hypothetical protein